MNFTVTIGSFLKNSRPAILVATKGIEKDWATANLIEINAEESEVTLSAFGGKMATQLSLSDLVDSNLSYKCEEIGKVVVNAEHFSKAINSFNNFSDIVTIKSEGKNLSISRGGKNKGIQKVPLQDVEIHLPVSSDQFCKKTKIQRDVFVEGIQKVEYAIGFEERRPEYLYLKIEMQHDNTRFIAGTGGRFAIYTVEGKVAELEKDENKTFFLIMKDIIPVITDVFSKLSCDYVELKQTGASEDVSDQIVLTCGDVEFIIVGFDPEIDWSKVKIDGVLKKKNSVSILTNTSNWEESVKGINATYTKDIQKEHEAHNADVVLDTKEEKLIVRIDSSLVSIREIQVDKIEAGGEDQDSLQFRCHATYLSEIVSQNPKNVDVRIEFDGPKNPVFIKHLPSTNDAKGTKEHMVTFFATTMK